MKRRVFLVILSIVLALSSMLAIACDGKGNTEQEEENRLTSNALSFIDAVDAIGTVTEESGEAITSAKRAYSVLNEGEKKFAEVQEKATLLTQKNNEYLELVESEEDKAQKALEKQTKDDFLAMVELLPVVANVTKDNMSAAQLAKEKYSELSAASKSEADVSEAWTKVSAIISAINQMTAGEDLNAFVDKLDELPETITVDNRAQITMLKSAFESLSSEAKALPSFESIKERYEAICDAYQLSVDQAKIEEYIAAVDFIDAEITLESGTDITSAERIYSGLSTVAKENADVIAKKAVMDGYLSQYNYLVENDQIIKINSFVEKANLLQSLETVALEDYDKIIDAVGAYDLLTNESKTNTQVATLYEKVTWAKTEFDKLGYKKASVVGAALLYSGDNPPHIVIQNMDLGATGILPDLYACYEVTDKASLVDKVEMYLNVYADGVYVGKGKINYTTLVNGFILTNSSILKIMKSIDNPACVSGANFTFTLQLVDLTGKFVPFDESLPSAVKSNYTW